MHVLPPVANPLAPRTSRRWLPPMKFALKGYLKLCRDFDAALAELEARYPTSLPPLTLEGRQAMFKKPRPK